MKSTSVRIQVSLLTTPVAHRYHQQAESRNHQSVTHLKLEVTPSGSNYKQHSTTKAATKLAAAPSALLANNSKAPMTVPKTPLPTTFLPTENAAPTDTVLDCGGPENLEKPNNLPLTMASIDRKKKQGNQLQKRSVSFFATSQKPLTVEANSSDDLITFASLPGQPKLDFENLHFKIASRLGETLNEELQETSHTAEGKAKSEKRSLAGKQIACMIYDIFQISGDNETILDFRVCRKFN